MVLHTWLSGALLLNPLVAMVLHTWLSGALLLNPLAATILHSHYTYMYYDATRL